MSVEAVIMCYCMGFSFQVILIENKEESLVRAESRCDELGVANIGFIQANLDYFTGPFHVGVSVMRLHRKNKNQAFTFSPIFSLLFNDPYILLATTLEGNNRNLVVF